LAQQAVEWQVMKPACLFNVILTLISALLPGCTQQPENSADDSMALEAADQVVKMVRAETAIDHQLSARVEDGVPGILVTWDETEPDYDSIVALISGHEAVKSFEGDLRIWFEKQTEPADRTSDPPFLGTFMMTRAYDAKTGEWIPAGKSPGPPEGTYRIDTVSFVNSNPMKESSGPAPGIWIDTDLRLSSLVGGTLKSHKPYDIAFDYTDNSYTFKTLEFTGVNLTYDDGQAESKAASLKLPLRIPARKYESVNSVTGGRVVKTTLRLLSGRMSGIITRDEAFTLKMEGRFIKEDGSTIPFAIDQHYGIETENAIRPAAEVLQDR
jgi:hypothetical protein